MEAQSAKAALPVETTEIFYNNEEIRIVMVGKTGAGKSTTGNTILGKQEFKAKFSPKSVTEICAKAAVEVAGQTVSVIDTPGLFDTKTDKEKTLRTIVRCISFASPGPHIFLIVIKLDRFTEEEMKAVQKIQEIFGEQADKYSMVLFTHGDQLRGQSMEEFLSDSDELQELVARCNGRYQVFDNNLDDRSQVSQLLCKIRNITKENGGSHYTTDMFQKAERAIENEKRQILKEREKQMRKEQEEVKREIEKKYEKKMREVKEGDKGKKSLSMDLNQEIETTLKALKKKQQRMARELAETSENLLEALFAIITIAGFVASIVMKFR